jgi:hypothetical protein
MSDRQVAATEESAGNAERQGARSKRDQSISWFEPKALAFQDSNLSRKLLHYCHARTHFLPIRTSVYCGP